MEYQNELDFAKDLALKSGAIMRKYFSLDVKSTMKDNITPVTAADTEINALVIESIQKKFPGHAVIAEEESAASANAEYTWICDPLDGTIPYSIGMQTAMVSLALYKDKQPVVGVLYDPFMDRLYHAVEGNVTMMNQTKTNVVKGLLTMGDCMGMILMDVGVFETQKLIDPLLKKEIRLLQIHSFVYVVSYIASGKLKGAFLPTAHIWDRAAAKIILENAGGTMTDENGNDLDIFSENSKMIIASNGECHEELLELVSASKM